MLKWKREVCSSTEGGSTPFPPGKKNKKKCILAIKKNVCPPAPSHFVWCAGTSGLPLGSASPSFSQRRIQPPNGVPPKPGARGIIIWGWAGLYCGAVWWPKFGLAQFGCAKTERDSRHHARRTSLYLSFSSCIMHLSHNVHHFRFKLQNALAVAGLLNSDYARQIISLHNKGQKPHMASSIFDHVQFWRLKKRGVFEQWL